MNNKLVLFLLLIFLILLLLFYYLQIQSNIIIIICVIIILLLNDLIMNKEHFNNESNLDSLLSRVDNTLKNLSKLKQSVETKTEEQDVPYLEVNSSCTPNWNTQKDSTIEDKSDNPMMVDTLQGINVPNLDNDGLPLSIDSSELLSSIN